MNIKLLKTITFPEKISVFEASGSQEHYVVDSKTGNYYILGKDLNIIRQFRAPWNRSETSAVHPKKQILAIMSEEKALHIVDFTGRELWSRQGEYIAACWNLDGTMLYTLMRQNPEILNLIVYDNNGKIITQKLFRDELYVSSAFLRTIPSSSDMMLDLMAGQDGCSIVFISISGQEICLNMLDKQRCFTNATFNPSGTRFLCIENYKNTIHHFTWPALEEIGVYVFDKECNMGYSVIYLNGKAIINYGENYYLLDTFAMEVIDDIIVEEHEPVPVYKIYQNLKEKELISDIVSMTDAGEYIFGCVADQISNSIVVLKKSDI